MKTKQAFTLIELLVVIAIIAILAAILFPVFAQAKLAAKKTTSISGVRQIGLASVMYSADYDDAFVPLYNTVNLASPTMPLRYWPVNLMPYTKNEQIFLDPQDTAQGPSFFGDRFATSNPLHAFLVGSWPSFGINYKYLNTLVNDPSFPYYAGVSTTSLGSPSKTVFITEATSQGVVDPGTCQQTTTAIGYAKVLPPSKWTGWAAGGYSGGCGGPFDSTFPALQIGQIQPRYSKTGVIVAWVDGHAKFTPLGVLKGSGTAPDTLDVAWNGLADN